MYLVAIVAIVAIVGLVLLFMNNGSGNCGKQAHSMMKSFEEPMMMAEPEMETESSDLAGQGWFATTADHKQYLKCKWDACDKYIKPSHPDYQAPTTSAQKRTNNAEYRKCFLVCKANVLSGAYPPVAKPKVCQAGNASICVDAHTVGYTAINTNCEEYNLGTEPCYGNTTCRMEEASWAPNGKWAFCE